MLFSWGGQKAIFLVRSRFNNDFRSTHNAEQLLSSMVPSILTSNFDLIFLAFRGQNELFLELG